MAITTCHHCGNGFGEDEARIRADVLVTGESRPQRIVIHEQCIPEDRFLRYLWQNVTIDRGNQANAS